ncbi:hypothetical protein CAPTEDRAFT_183312 [Capitella teleta]|uniref:CWH43-like N-terminal domain-containing protein n=1 Tax=Capitella teleta TaxID=283909 RepID=R7VHN6_CAPTE|nr:hypothetical protein CAPTEDRAFT_183312 [Capitella teleta]|eukprot:ELU15811.1 hypothetical protein CAPTEDRAFT_183312 [Capitella teleta]
MLSISSFRVCFLSDTGAIPPESCIFAQLLNLTAVVVGATVYVRYRHVRETCMDRPKILIANKVSLVLGLLAALGVSMVGNFQETNVLVVHLIGAILAFGIGTVYCWLTSALSYKMCPSVSSRLTCHIRVLISSFTSVAFIITFTLDGIAKRYFHGNDPRKWYPSDGGWSEHLVSTVSEWLMAIAMLMFFLTFVGEFKSIHVGEPPLVIIVSESTSTNSHDSAASYGACRRTSVTA